MEKERKYIVHGASSRAENERTNNTRRAAPGEQHQEEQEEAELQEQQQHQSKREKPFFGARQKHLFAHLRKWRIPRTTKKFQISLSKYLRLSIVFTIFFFFLIPSILSIFNK